MWQNKLTELKDYLKQHKKTSLLGVCVLGIVLLVAGRSLLGQHKPTRKIVKPLVHTMALTKQPMYRHIKLFGQIKPEARIDIVNKYAGVIDEIKVDLGQRVEAGQLLAQQRLTDAAAEVQKTQARYQEASANAATYDTDYTANIARYEADYKLAKVNAERYEKLFKMGAVSQYERDAMQQTMVNKKALYEELALQRHFGNRPSQVYRQEQIAERRYQEYIIAQNKYEDMVFRAPRSGVVVYRNAEVGAYAAAGTKLLSILDDSGYKVDCELTEADAAAFNEGAKVQLLVESMGEECRGTVVYVSPDRSRESNKFYLRVRLDEWPAKLKAGLFARGELQLLQKQAALFVPKSSLYDRNGKYYAYVLTAGNKVEQRALILGASNEQEVEVLKGLQEGEQVILDNLSRLRAGMTVDVAQEGK
ncbi:MAG: efflux RND transporter periplasmic adaptor subunit [Phascolarctobacterium sp.]